MTFLKDVRVLFLLFILGDTLTTIYALHTGLFYEGNPVLSQIFNAYGYLSLIPIKASFLILLYHVYKNADRFYWNITRHSVSCIGLLATVCNTAVVFHG
ncbi:hypothetical protein SAMN04488589_0510 [Methanolobus vulcani]|uniref:DUF5658 domain-containing protein n=1 Tax=Methanolobus vulcani TaxID=38026 RepID=A0A7Z7AVW8_9EURY|nr:DUF5658 family protein [Methanolobus vulcani]SDF43514.1 hypothetical protein SAMN04488589_0510 [Methanolobus vulcani]